MKLLYKTGAVFILTAGQPEVKPLWDLLQEEHDRV